MIVFFYKVVLYRHMDDCDCEVAQYGHVDDCGLLCGGMV